MNDTVRGITPESDREHVISLYGHVKGIERELTSVKDNHLKHMKYEIDRLGGKVDKIYWVVLTTVGAVGLIIIEALMNRIGM